MLAPVVMGGTGLITILQSFALSSTAVLPVLGALVIPSVGTSLVAYLLAKQRWGHACMALAGWFGAHAVAAGVWTSLFSSSSNDAGGIMMCVLVVSGMTALLALPAFIAAGAYGARRDLEAGDAYLGFSGAWYLLGNALALYALFRPESTDTHWLAAVPGMVAGVVAIALYVGRTLSRRSFTARAARGEVSGWRVRSMTDRDDLATIPTLFGSPLHATAVLERVEIGGAAYRSAVVGIPMARVGGTAARLAEQSAPSA